MSHVSSMTSFKQSLKTVDTISVNIIFNMKMTGTQKLENYLIIKFCCNVGMTRTKTFEKNAAGKLRK